MHNMNVRIVPSICVLGFGIMASAWVAVFGYQNFDWALHSSLSVLAASILASLALIQKWTHFAWLPLAAYTVACIGIITDQQTLTTAGYFSFAVATVWHGHQKEKIGKPNDKTYSSY